MPTIRLSRALGAPAFALLAITLVAACSDGSADTAPRPVTPGQVASLGLTVTPAVIAVQQGQSATATITLTRSGDARRAVTLATAIAGSPEGVTAALAPAVVAAEVSESVVTFSTSAGVQPGEHVVTIDGGGSGLSARATVMLRVTAAPPPPPPPPAASYTLAVSPSPVSVTAGGAAATATVALARANFAGAVTLAASGAPAGLTVTVPSAATSDASAAVSVQAAPTVVAGDYPITLTGNAAGLAPVTTGLVVRVAAAAPAQPSPTVDPGVVTGVALDGRGRPIANALVQVKMMFNPNVVTAHTGADGRYTVRGLPAGLAHKVWAWYEVTYGGRSYCSRLAMPNVGDYDPFVPSSAVTRDFRWQLTGRIPDAGNNYFGASLAMSINSADWDTLLEDGDQVELRLTPQGPLVDGSEAAVVTRTVRFARSGWDSRLDDIPHGIYTAQATRVRGGVRTTLKVGRAGTGLVAPTTVVEWEPEHSPGTCGGVLGPDLRTFSLRLAPE
ncbi:MAG TPA: carboxypeptidase-like regulatory domain-containing protein [Gemmatirosa sp.]|nr:carboxypeptidase-like regulatory domain-containing protein [Gemmatirosa sp.]